MRLKSNACRAKQKSPFVKIDLIEKKTGTPDSIEKIQMPEF